MCLQYECVDACLVPMLQQRFQITGKAGCLKEAFYPPPLILPNVSNVCPAFLCFKCMFCDAKNAYFLFKNANQDHFWSRTYSEVVSLTVFCIRKKHISFNKNSSLFTHHTLRILFSLLPIFVSLCVLAFLQDSSQIGLLKELLDLQKDMVVMLLSLLEGM